MTNTLRRALNDSPLMRWSALFIVAFAMMIGYYICYEMSPLQDLLETRLGWSSTEYGIFSGSYGFINVFLLMLFFGGIILDKMGVRFTGLLSCVLMLVGVGTLYYAIEFVSPDTTTFVSLPLPGLHGQTVKDQVLLACLGFSVFGVGDEMCGITVSKVMVKWFTGHEMAVAMGIQVAMARLGTGAAMAFSVPLALRHTLSTPLMLGTVLACIALLVYIVYCVMDVRLDSSLTARATDTKASADEESFRMSDILITMRSPGFWLITLLCLLFYSAMSPFFNFATKLMIAKYGVDPSLAGYIPAIIPFGSIILTPLFGSIYDRVGHGATLIIIGTVMMAFVHTMFALPIYSGTFAVAMMIILGLAFSLVPSAMWPSVPKIIPLKRLGTAYSIIFFIQNIGLMVVRLIVGRVLDANTVIAPDGQRQTDFTQAMTVFALFGFVAVVVAFALRWIDSRKHYGLQQANIRHQKS